MTTRVEPSKMANAVRALAMDAVQKANSGHPGLPMGAADVATVLFTQFLKYDAAEPNWPDRDRFILSAGHGSMLLYALLYLTGNKEMTLDQIKNFRQLNSKTPGHPENFITSGVETTTGPLGQGIATSVGFALAEQLLAAEFGSDTVDHYTYVLCSDGDLMEGISHEAIALAGHLKLNKLIFLYDDNGITIDGPITLTDNVDQVARFKAHGWNAKQIDGHDPKAIASAIRRAQKSDRPSLIACKTIIGFGAPHKAGTSKAHGEPLGADELAATKKALDWNYGPFEVPDEVLAAWRKAGKKGSAARKNWRKRFEALPEAQRAEFQRRVIDRKLPADLDAVIGKLKDKLAAEPQTVATRKASELALDVLVPAVPELLLGSADLTPSNNTRTKGLKEIQPGQYDGRYIHYGIRELGMAAAMNGLALHGGFRPAGGTFLCFTDYARPAMRISALAHIPVIYIMTHDSIGLGEDGPTHQPVEHIAALRAMPNMRVFRPADPVETAECWQLALERLKGPSVLALSRQNLTPVR
ncbi:MAG: transketolase, partial [Rhizobiales bacterium]|nr:transketolase [Hyphomicrobiales bacterium]